MWLVVTLVSYLLALIFLLSEGGLKVAAQKENNLHLASFWATRVANSSMCVRITFKGLINIVSCILELNHQVAEIFL